MNPFDQQAPVPGIKKIIAVGSGKGGVGKSTITTNLAIALKNLGHKVGLLDADIYGPSIPRMFGAINQNPPVNDAGKIIPNERQGIKLMSIGFLVEEDQPLVWRGPMLFKAVEQFFRDVDWGELDYLVIDLPPGTGEVALTIAQKVPVHGGITVCTPQNIALIDAKKSMGMFEQVNIPNLGVVENMAYMKQNGDRVQLFPKGELDSYLEKSGIKKLAEVPFHQPIAMGAEAGIPFTASSKDEEVEVFNQLAKKVAELVPV